MSRQFDVHRLRPRRGATDAILVVNLQSDFVRLGTRVVAPLVAASGRPLFGRLAVPMVFEDAAYRLSVGEMIVWERRDLGPTIGSVADHRDAIVRALDLLFTGI